MTGDLELLVGIVMLAGLVGVLLPVLPGLLLIAAAGLWWTIADGGGAVRWTVFGVLTALFVVTTVVKYVLPAKRASAQGAPVSTLLAGVALGVVGFFVIPVVGAAVGFVLGIYLAELARLGGDGGRAWASTRAALVAIGIGVLIELTAGVLMIGTWLIGVWVT